MVTTEDEVCALKEKDVTVKDAPKEKKEATVNEENFMMMMRYSKY